MDSDQSFVEKVLITGISGYLGLHSVIKCLESGYYVVGAIRVI